MKFLISLIAVAAGLITAFAMSPMHLNLTADETTQAKPPSRTVHDQELVSSDLPAIKIKFDKAFHYAGHQSFVLYDVANAEQHFFVDAGRDGRIKRLYWIQFEGYLANNTHTYRYKANQTVDIAGLPFFADANALNLQVTTSRPDSDGSRARAFLQSKGYGMASDEVLMQRLVHLTDETKRNELMIIYMEALSGLGVTAGDLGEGGSAAGRWNEISRGLLERAIKGMKVSR